MHKKYKFTSNETHYLLMQQGSNENYFVHSSWPKDGYSWQKARKGADRWVGEAVRHADPGTQFTYEDDNPERLSPDRAKAEATRKSDLYGPRTGRDIMNDL